MIKPICKDIEFLKRKSEKATKQDLPLLQDLEDTLRFHRDECVGMALNMIGINKCIISVLLQDFVLSLVNPVIVKTYGGVYEAEEGCLSLSGKRKVKRFERIEVSFLDKTFKKQRMTFSGFQAEIIQHEMDHLEGIII